MLKKRKARAAAGALLAAALLVQAPVAVQADRLPWYEQEWNVTGTGGAAATEHPLATKAAMDIMRAGGNAVEAAIAASAVQGVVRPFSGGIGGGGYMHIYLKDQNRFVVLDHRSAAAGTFGPHSFLDANGKEYDDDIREISGISVGVPGVVKAWETALQQYGTGLSLATILQPAIDAAENGFYADHNFIRELTENAPRFRNYQSTIDLFLNPDGSVPPAGTLMKNEDLADTYRLIAQQGSSAFYNGPIGQAIVDAVYSPPTVANPPNLVLPGSMSLADLQNYTVRTTDPVKVQYRGYDIYGPAPSSSGGTTVGEALNILEGYDMANLPREEALHYYLEASRRAFADRTYLGDPSTYSGAMPVAGLLNEEYAEHIRQYIDDRASEGVVPAGDPWPYDANPSLKAKPLHAAGKVALAYDFAGGANGSGWDPAKFATQTRNASSTIQVQNEAGKLHIDSGLNAYARAESTMAPVSDSELLVRFKMDALTGDRNLRFWLRADGWNGSTSPHNGYGFELNTADDTVRFIRTRQSNGVFGLGTFNHARTTDWQWLRFRVEGDQLKVRLWKDGEHEPRQDWSFEIEDDSVVGKGKLMLAGIELTGSAGTGGSFQVDDIVVAELNPAAFRADFTGVADGASWDSTGGFTTQFGRGASNPGVGSSIAVNDESGHIALERNQFSYARAQANMPSLYDSELLVKFRINELGGDRNLRFWLRSDGWNSLAAPHNGYGLEVKSGSDKLRILRTRNSNGAFALAEIDHPRTTNWQWLRFRVEGEGIKVRVWEDGTPEPIDWLHERSNADVTAPGTFKLVAVESTGSPTGTGGTFDVDDMQVYDLDVLKTRQSTIHLTVADEDGNIVAYTHTLNSIGGNGMVVPGYGILLNDELAPRVPSSNPPGHPDGPRPGMRPLSSMSPTIVMKDGEPVLALGSPGGSTIITTVLQTLVNYLDFGMTLPQAVTAPRLSQGNSSAVGHTLIEPEFLTTPEYDQLRARGQRFDVTGLSYGIGAVNAIEFLPNGQVRAVSEQVRRGGGSAMVDSEYVP
ncbi:gamma-glutamyltransferase [Paenibacillus flagellatus]|uniref:Gamma-glutamyltransferase n=1 Tax=Paenibacillus flagellatus TaxID=2211139 RepID=A0A2V5KZM2_9BACL|nr:gamma-glutamyltransferase [Paenibacillus flagellatus]PYI55626.1 hypothetical protein DLM86_07815 [Paenibacillus flagellatus]